MKGIHHHFRSSMAYTILLALLVSCSSYRAPESFDDKMDRFQAKMQGQNQVPKFTISNKSAQVAMSKTAAARNPASIQSNIKSESKYSNKRLYFLSLYFEYESMRKLTSQTTKDIKICPHFHSGIVENRSYLNEIQKSSSHTAWMKELAEKATQAITNDGDVALQEFPILSLPINNTVESATVYDTYQKKHDSLVKLFDDAILLHANNTHSELEELCEYGTSDNYFIYENLVTYSQNNKLVPSQQSFEVLLRTTLVSNFFLEKAILGQYDKGRGPASQSGSNPYLYPGLGRLDATWAMEYLTAYFDKNKK